MWHVHAAALLAPRAARAAADAAASRPGLLLRALRTPRFGLYSLYDYYSLSYYM